MDTNEATDDNTTAEEKPADHPIQHLRDAYHHAVLAENDLDGRAEQFARVAGTVLDWALDGLDADPTGGDDPDLGARLDREWDGATPRPDGEHRDPATVSEGGDR